MVISGALTARGLSNKEFSEVTLGAKSQKDADEIKQILQVSGTDIPSHYPLH